MNNPPLRLRIAARTSIRGAVLVPILALPLGLSGAAGGSVVSDQASGQNGGMQSPRVRVVVELEGEPLLPKESQSGHESRTDVDSIYEEQDALLDAAGQAGLDVDVSGRLSAVVNGLVLEVAESGIPALSELPGISMVHEDVAVRADLNDSVELIGAQEVWDEQDPAGSPVTGLGTTIAVLDTGVDYNHPDLGGGFGEGMKVVAGWDFVNDDADPLDDNGHGTHVAGAIAADGEVVGVAPAGELTAYKVLDKDGNGSLANVLLGLDAAVSPENEHRADVVNMSLGVSEDGGKLLGKAAALAVESGVIVVASAGNSGPDRGTIGYPAADPAVLSVGASTSGVVVPRIEMIGPELRELQATRLEASAPPPEDSVEAELVDLGDGTLPKESDVAGKVVMFTDSAENLEKVVAAEDAGAVAALLYIPAQLPSGEPSDSFSGSPLHHSYPLGLEDGRFTDIVLAQIPGATADALQRELAQGVVMLEISPMDLTDTMAGFSSRGPTVDFSTGPDLVAPGVEILSTIPSGHARGSGTSMATPHVSGAAALLRQVHSDWPATHVQGALAGSAHLVEEGGPSDQGAGRIDVAAAIDAQMLAVPASLSLGLASRDSLESRVSGTGSVALHNLSEGPITPSISVIPNEGNEADVEVAVADETVLPGDSTNLVVNVSSSITNRETDIEGWVLVDIDGDGAPEVRVPYSMAVRNVKLSASPDPVQAHESMSIRLTSPAPATDPQLVVDCPGMPTVSPSLNEIGAQVWAAEVDVGAAGLCELSATVTTSGGPSVSATLPGSTQVEVIPPANLGDGGTTAWQAIGPNDRSGLLLFDAVDDQRLTVMPHFSATSFVTEDAGLTWEQHALPVAGGRPWDGEVHPTRSGVIYIVLQGTNLDPTYDGKVLRSEDAGRTWSELPYPDVPVKLLAVSQVGALAVHEYSGAVRISTDEGQTWRLVDQGLDTVWGMEFDGEDLYLAGTSGLEVIRAASTDQPATREVVYKPGVLGWANQVAVTEESVLVSAGGSGAKIYASTDNGENFEEVLTGTGSTFNTLSANGETVLAANSRGAWRSTDHGHTWEHYGDIYENDTETDIGMWAGSDVRNDAEFLVSGYNSGVAKVAPREEVEIVGVAAAMVDDLVATRADGRDFLIAGTDIDLRRLEISAGPSTQPQEQSWEGEGEAAQMRTVSYLDSSRQAPSIVFRAQEDTLVSFSIDRSSDGGSTWRHLVDIPGVPNSLLVHPADADRIFVSAVDGRGRRHLALSMDGGERWAMVESGFPITSLAGDPVDPETIYAGSGRQGLHRSIDGGRSFEKILDEEILAVAVDPADRDHIVAAGRDIYVSKNGGESFDVSKRESLDARFTDVEFLPFEGRVVVGSGMFYDDNGLLHNGRGVLQSIDGGATWESISAGLADLDVTTLEVSVDGQWLFAGTEGGSVHRLQLRR